MSQKKSGPQPEPALEAYRDRMSDSPVPRVQHKTEWQERRAVVREKLLQALGLQPMPDRLPLEVKSGGVLERESYRVERLYWQTWPGVYAGGWLYTPANSEERAPAILIPCVPSGPHGEPDGVHGLLARLAQLGYVGLAVDSSSAFERLEVGLTLATAPTLNGLRGLDLLAGRPEVDRQRIGLAAPSAGVAVAVFLLALDDRIHASALATCSLSRRSRDCTGSTGFIIPGIMRITTGPELCAVASPRAMLFILPEGEHAVAFRAGELRELRTYYHLWQQPDRLAQASIGDGELTSPAAFPAVYAWFERELRGNRNPEPLAASVPSLGDVSDYAALEHPVTGYGDSEAISHWYDKRVVAQPPQLEGKPARRKYQDRVNAELHELLGLPAQSCSLSASSAARTDLTTRTPDHLSAPNTPTPNTVSFRSEHDVRIPALWLPGTGPQPYPALIAVHPEGKEAALKTEMVRSFQAAGYGVLAPDVRLRGELLTDWIEETRLWGRPEAGMAVTDVHACVRWLLGEESVDARGIVLWGDGALGISALLAAGLEERITATVADCGLTTYRDGGEDLPMLPNILRVADVPQLASLVAPRPLWLYQVPEERVGFSSRRYYDWTRRSFQSLGEVEALKMSTKSLPEPQVLLDWLKTRLRRARR